MKITDTRMGSWTLIAIVATLALALMMGAPSPALAVNEFCDVVSGAVGTGECLVNAVHNPASGPFTIDRNLHIPNGGSLVTGAAGITITITPSGNFVMDSGALIDGNVAGCNTGGKITVTVVDGDVDLATGSIIRSNSCSGGRSRSRRLPRIPPTLTARWSRWGRSPASAGRSPRRRDDQDSRRLLADRERHRQSQQPWFGSRARTSCTSRGAR